MKTSTKIKMINFIIFCMMVSILGTFVMIVETWFPFGDWVKVHIGILGVIAGYVLGILTFIGWIGWVMLLTQILKDKGILA